MFGVLVFVDHVSLAFLFFSFSLYDADTPPVLGLPLVALQRHRMS